MQPSTFEAYSPRISATLIVNGHRFNVREMSSDLISVEADHIVGPCDAEVEAFVGDDRDLINIRLLEGTDPARDEQPIRIKD